MSSFNKLFIGGVIAATMLAVAHTGAWAWRANQAIEAMQSSEVESTVALASNALSELPS